MRPVAGPRLTRPSVSGHRSRAIWTIVGRESVCAMVFIVPLLGLTLRGGEWAISAKAIVRFRTTAFAEKADSASANT